MNYSTTQQVNDEYNSSNDSDDTDDMEEFGHRAQWPPEVIGSIIQSIMITWLTELHD